MKATLVNKSTIVVLDGSYRYTIKRVGAGKSDFKVRKERLDTGDTDIFDDELEEVKDGEEEEEEEEEE